MERERDAMGKIRTAVAGESGFALIVALLALLLLTFLGLTLATTTSTEMQIAANYRWAQQAFYMAEGGLEIAKRQLRAQSTWNIFVPPARPVAAMGSIPVGWPPTGATRDFENNQCDAAGHEGYGVVLSLAGFGVWENQNVLLGQQLDGSFTIWVRRPVSPNNDGILADYANDDRLVVTAEGTAPYRGTAAGGNVAIQRRAVRVLEIDVSKINPGDCESDLGGQAGNSALGANYDPCAVVNAAGIPGAGGVAPTEVNPSGQ
jgi:Tfp pilus assembly protein PilX